MSDRIEPLEFNGHQFYPLATRLTTFKPGLYFYTVSINYLAGYNVSGNSSTQGLVKPREGVQYGELYTDVLEFARNRCDGRLGTKVVTFAHLALNVQL